MTSNASRIKILVGGPAGAGKSVVANLLSGLDRPDMVKTPSPTQGVRILELERAIPAFKSASGANLLAGGRDSTVTVELWDASGDDRYYLSLRFDGPMNHGEPWLTETSFLPFWLSTCKDIAGLVLVMNADMRAHDRAVEQWASMFPTLKSSQLLVLAQKHENPAQSRPRPKLGKPLARAPLFLTSLENEADVIKNEFNQFVANCVRAAAEQNDAEERAVLAGAGGPVASAPVGKVAS
ncbi:Intraflagellar transport protein 22 [Allomyces arbusculus]|nr:Intraflagellar transport protein 22 [Allomyces arbusculus]